MFSPLTRHLARWVACLSICAPLAGCAALHAPVAFEAIDRPTAAVERVLRLEAVEGRPVGLVLRFWSVDEVSADVWLEVLRQTDGAPAERIRSVRLDERLRARLTGEGFEFLDRSVPVDTPTFYQIRLRASEEGAPAQLLAVSDPLPIVWQTPPARPEQVQSSSEISGAVELRWAPSTAGALIFRRDVLDDNARPRRLARPGPKARGVFVDRDVEPGGVYAYQVALAVDTGTTIQFGRPSDEIYVTVRAAP